MSVNTRIIFIGFVYLIFIDFLIKIPFLFTSDDKRNLEGGGCLGVDGKFYLFIIKLSYARMQVKKH